MKIIITVSFFLCALLVLGCSPDSGSPEPKGVIPEQQLKALEDAKKTQDLIDKSEKDRKKALQ